MRFFLSIILAAFLVIPSTTFANVKAEWAWHLVDNEPKRVLHVCFHSSMNNQWKGWGRAAMKLWNDAKEQTGWEFEEVPFSRAQCQIFIILADIDESNTGGADIHPLDVLEGQREEADGRVNGAIITIDSHLEDTSDWISEDEDTSDGAHDGWSTNEDDGTRDPIDTIAHELSHTLRLDHHDDYSRLNPDADLSDPKQPGEHYHALSPADITQATAANRAAWVRASKNVGANGGKNLAIGHVYVDIPEYTFGMNYINHVVSVLDTTDMTSVPFNVPEEYSHVFQSLGIFADVSLKKPIRVTLPYNEEVLALGGMQMNNIEGFSAPGLLEDTITVVRFEKKAWDLTSVVVKPNPSGWELLDAGSEEQIIKLDVENNEITFEITETGYYGLIAKSDPDLISKDLAFQVVRDGKVRTPQGPDKETFSIDMRVPLTVGFFSTILIGVLGYFLRRKKK